MDRKLESEATESGIRINRELDHQDSVSNDLIGARRTFILNGISLTVSVLPRGCIRTSNADEGLLPFHLHRSCENVLRIVVRT